MNQLSPAYSDWQRGIVMCSKNVDITHIKSVFNKWPKTNKMMLVSLLSSLGAIFQSAGGFLPGIGLMISPLATAPVLLCSVFSISLGIASYILIALLLIILQPAELIIFPFTTGLLGLFIGSSFHFFRKVRDFTLSGCAGLMIGICVLLYGFHFPILGPAVSYSFSFAVVGFILVFSLFYSWIWVLLGRLLVKRVAAFLL